jgi:hypothetical protein
MLAAEIGLLERDDPEPAETPMPFAFIRIVVIVIAVELRLDGWLSVFHDNSLAFDFKEEIFPDAILAEPEVGVGMDAFLKVGLLPVKGDLVLVAILLKREMVFADLQLVIERAFVLVEFLAAVLFHGASREPVDVGVAIIVQVGEFYAVDHPLFVQQQEGVVYRADVIRGRVSFADDACGFLASEDEILGEGLKDCPTYAGLFER